MSGPAITDHALLRFLERGAGLDVEQLRSDLSKAFERAHSAARAMGSSDYLIRIDGLTAVVRGDAIITMLPSGSPTSEAHKLKGKP